METDSQTYRRSLGEHQAAGEAHVLQLNLQGFLLSLLAARGTSWWQTNVTSAELSLCKCLHIGDI